MKMTNPKMIIFDYGGTLLHEPGCDFLRGEKALFKHIVRNPNHLTAEQLCAFGNQLYESFQPCRSAGYEIHEMQLLRLQYEYNKIEFDISYEEAEKILWDNTSPLTEKARMPHVLEMLDSLKKEGIRTGVISNIGWSGNALKERIDYLLPNNEFEFVIASSEYGIRKPNPMIFELALNKAGLQPSEVWYCGDTFEMDVVGAHNAGIFPVLYTGTTENGPKRKAVEAEVDYPYLVIEDWRELKEYA